MKDNYKKSNNNFKKASRGGDIVSQDESEIKHVPIQAKPLEVKVYNNNADKALRAFRALVQKERILSIYKEKQSYEKPSDRRRRKFNEMKRKMLELDYPASKNIDKNSSKKKYKSDSTTE